MLMCLLQTYKSGVLYEKQSGLLRGDYVLQKATVNKFCEGCWIIVKRMFLLVDIPLFRYFFSFVPGYDVKDKKLDENNCRLIAVFVGLLMLSTLFLLYIFRGYDDNRLMSWQWIFVGDVIYFTGLYVVLGLFLSWWLSGFQLSVKSTLVALLCFSFVVCSVQWSQPELIIDTSRYFLQAKSLSENGPVYFTREWGGEIAVWTDLPLIPFIYGLLFKYVGEYRVAVQFLTTIFFCGTVLLTYLIGKELWDDITGLYGGALLLGMPFLLTQVPLMLVDVPTMFFLHLAIYSMILAVKSGAITWIVTTVLTIILALLCKYSTWLMLSVLLVISLCCRSGSWVELGKTTLYIFFGVVLVLSVLFLLKYQVIVQQFSLLINYQAPGLGRWHESHVSTFLYQVHPVITLAALFSIYIAWARRDIRYLVVGWMVLLVLVLGVKRIRYLLIVFPMLSLMAAYAVRNVSDSRIRNYTVYCVVVFSVVVTLYSYSSFTHKTSAMNIVRAGEFINKTNSSAVEIVVLSQPNSMVNPFVSVPLLDLFTKKNIVYLENLSITSRPIKKILNTSSVRFSWEYDMEKYYATSNAMIGDVIVVVSSSDNYPLPEIIKARLNNFHLVRRFNQADGVFRYSTIVDVYSQIRRHSDTRIIQGLKL